MNKISISQSGFFNPRALLAFALCLSGVSLTLFSFKLPVSNSANPRNHNDAIQMSQLRYMPEPGGKADDFDRMEAEWNIRLTYPTGIFNPAWLRLAAAKDALIPRGIPAGVPLNLKNTASPLALTTNGFTALGPQPEHMTGCTGCYDYVTTEGRVNTIVVDPTITTAGSIVAYLGSVGGGVWKTTNCCSASTS